MPMDVQKVVIIIPFYRNSLSAYEIIALQQCQRILSAYPTIAVKPATLTLPDAAYTVSFASEEQFNEDYFKSIAGYNRLLLSTEFYERFIAYDYMLIYQLDAFVFKDDLTYWCSQEIDYVGAPWIRYKDDSLLKKWELSLKSYLYTRLNIKRKGVPSSRQFMNKVGNGGLSLRRVKKFRDITISMQALISYYLSHSQHQYNEDMFWSIEVNRKQEQINIPSWQVGLKFAVEFAPERALTLNNQQLPFGCHAWDRHVHFWRPVFKQLGYNI
jgi:hypothetical protein